MAKERLDKALGHMGFGSRREVKELVKRRRIAVDDVICTDPGQQVDLERQTITVDGKSVAFQRHFYVMLHKPGGIITATEDPNKPTVMDVVPPELSHRDLFPVGRLDKDTEGLLLLTTDGELCHRVLSPKWHVDKCYFVRVEAPLDASDVPAFAQGLILEDGYECMPARLEIISAHEATVTIQEGKYHQVKRMFGVRGKPVIYLKRLTFGPLDLGDLPLGQSRALTDLEVDALYDSAGLARP